MGVSRTYAEKATLKLRKAGVCAMDFLPTKELLQMIEERIPFGRVLTTAALLLGVLAIIVAACVYLYHVVILPLVALLIAGFTTGKINPATFASFIGSIVTSVALYYTLEWLLRGNSRLIQESLELSKSVNVANERILTHAGEVRNEVNQAFTAIRKLEARVDTLEER